MKYQAVFCDIDGTLLDHNNRMLPGTKLAIRQLSEQNIPFVIVSGRYPPGIRYLQAEAGFTGPIVSFSGGLILDENGVPVYNHGFSKQNAGQIIDYIEEQGLDCTWNIFSKDLWIVRDRTNPRVIHQEAIVHAPALEGSLQNIDPDEPVNKILCMCPEDRSTEIEQQLKEKFPDYSIVKSSGIYLEVMPAGITKSAAVRKLCSILGISIENTIAFGDNYNDEDMLLAVGTPFIMENAPEPLKQKIQNVARSNDEEGIYHALKGLGMIQ